MKKNKTKVSVADDRIVNKILVVRETKVMIDADLGELYGVSTKRLNEQVRRNRKRFPSDFMFRLSRKEKLHLIQNIPHLNKMKYSPGLPLCFHRTWSSNASERAQ